jgi:transposase
MIEVKEVLRQWLSGAGKKLVARQVGVDVKTVRRYVSVAERVGVRRSEGVGGLTDDVLSRVMEELKRGTERERGASWEACRSERARIEKLIAEGVRLSKIGKLLKRQGVTVPYATLHRYAVAELGFGKGGTTIAVIEGEPGKELQVDTGWVGWLQTPEGRRRLRAWIFTPIRSRYRFVYPTFRETTEEAIAACEAAWRFYGGVFGVLLPDNPKAIVEKADPLGARLSNGFLEYAQTRGFVVDPARARHPKDKARVERSVSHVRDDCFSGESLKTLEEARRHAEAWCREDYGERIHSRTRRRPEEHFREEEKARLLPGPTAVYDVPRWSAATVERDQYVPVSRGLYSVPTKYVRRKLTARTDSQTVRLYEAGVLVKVHTRVGPGERATDPNDFPEAKRIYAHRDVESLVKKARELGENVGRMAETILGGPLPWTRMRRGYALLGLGRRYGPCRLDEACRVALEADMTDVNRLRQMLERAAPKEEPPRSAVVPIARYLRPRDHFAVRREEV